MLAAARSFPSKKSTERERRRSSKSVSPRPLPLSLVRGACVLVSEHAHELQRETTDQNERFIATSGGECTDTAKQLSNARQKGEQRSRSSFPGWRKSRQSGMQRGRASLPSQIPQSPLRRESFLKAAVPRPFGLINPMTIICRRRRSSLINLCGRGRL